MNRGSRIGNFSSLDEELSYWRLLRLRLLHCQPPLISPLRSAEAGLISLKRTVLSSITRCYTAQHGPTCRPIQTRDGHRIFPIVSLGQKPGQVLSETDTH